MLRYVLTTGMAVWAAMIVFRADDKAVRFWAFIAFASCTALAAEIRP